MCTGRFITPMYTALQICPTCLILLLYAYFVLELLFLWHYSLNFIQDKVPSQAGDRLGETEDTEFWIAENDHKLGEMMQVETSNKDTVTEIDQKDEAMFQELKNMMQEETSRNGQGQDSNQLTKIQRVLKVMKDGKDDSWGKKYFVPHAIAIGPIHAHSKDIWVSEKLKKLWAAKYMDGLDQKEKVVEEIRRKIKPQSTWFDEECFSKAGIKDEHELARMLFLDGCAMLQFIYSFLCDDLEDLKINAAQAISVQKDLFLLENQIPLWVLQSIMNGGKNKQQMEDEHIATMRLLKILFQENVKNLFGPVNEIKRKKPKNMETAIRMFINMSSMSTAVGPPTERKLTGVHLLDLLHQSLVDHLYSAPPDDFSNRAFNCLRSFQNLSVSVIFKLSYCPGISSVYCSKCPEISSVSCSKCPEISSVSCSYHSCRVLLFSQKQCRFLQYA